MVSQNVPELSQQSSASATDKNEDAVARSSATSQNEAQPGVEIQSDPKADKPSVEESKAPIFSAKMFAPEPMNSMPTTTQPHVID